MKQSIYFILCIFIQISLFSCKKSDPKPQEDSLDRISNIATFHGNLKSNTVVINTQGGPILELEDETLKEIISKTKTQSALFVNVKQEQMINPTKFQKTGITFIQAKEYNQKSVSNLKHVIDFFKKQKGKKVYVLGISFGAFMTQELISQHGIDIADGYLVMVGRLDIDKDTWEPFSQGKYTKYVYDNKGNFNIIMVDREFNTTDRNMAKLAAGLGHNRYTNKLSNLNDLSKITYVYGDRDEEVGPLSDKEIQFLKKRNANVFLLEGASHGGAIDKGLNLLKHTFKI